MAIKRIAASGGDYTTLSAWIASIPSTLTEPEIAELEAFDLVDQVFCANTTTAANYIEIRAAAGHEHNGVFGVGARIRIGSSGTAPPITYPGKHFRLRNIEVYSDKVGSTYQALKDAGGAVVGSDVRFENLLVRSVVAGENFAITAIPANLNITISNTVVVSPCRPIDTRGAASAKLHNSVFWRTANVLGVVAGATTEVVNCYSGSSVAGSECWWSGMSPTGDHNAASDATATARFTSSYNSITAASAFTNVSLLDFSPIVASPLIDVGATLATVTSDILGTARPQGAGYDIGAFEYNSASPDANGTGAPASITLTAPTGSATGTGGATNGTGTGTLQSIVLTAPAGSATGTSAGLGTITTPVLKNNTGLVLDNEVNVIVNVYNASTGALIVQKTGQTSNGSGIVTISDALIVPATAYAYEVVLTGSRRRLPVASAA